MCHHNSGPAGPASRPHQHDLNTATAAAPADLADHALRLSATPVEVDDTDLDIALAHQEPDRLACREALGQLASAT